MRIEAVIFLPAVACQMAVAVLVGQSLGNGDRKETQQSAYDMLGSAVLGMSLLTGCLWFVREELAALMTNNILVQAEAVRYLAFNFLSAPLMANLVLIGAFIGAGATPYAMWIYLASVECAYPYRGWDMCYGRLPAVYIGQWSSRSLCSSAYLSGCYPTQTGSVCPGFVQG
ncbi:MATE family efflux transporter [uncultured Bilophila sp.]|uniref:MATE family efflux transporter n=1 Tax=uncultured Bilophila sp. TaxID=529385 RepID=UPI00280B722B|nr:MATE family efflux transporter [uncultured Bilophila sp.]